jgi:hypothetical protein
VEAPRLQTACLSSDRSSGRIYIGAWTLKSRTLIGYTGLTGSVDRFNDESEENTLVPSQISLR